MTVQWVKVSTSISYTHLFQIPSVKTKSSGKHSSAYQGPIVWNKLTHNIRHAASINSFIAGHLLTLNFSINKICNFSFKE